MTAATRGEGFSQHVPGGRKTEADANLDRSRTAETWHSGLILDLAFSRVRA